MFKRYTLIIVIAVSSIFNLVRAQYGVGDWNIFPRYGSEIKKVIDTGNAVYFHVSESLFSYSEGELYAYTQRNKLNDSRVSDIYYNSDENYLLVIYSNSNIDLIYDNGKVVNIPDLKNVTLVSKKINDVSFSTDKIYLAADFGYMVLNRPKHEVKETYFFDSVVYGIAEVANHLMINVESKLYWIQLGKHVEGLQSFSESASTEGHGVLKSLNNGSFLMKTNEWKLGKLANGQISWESISNSSESTIEIFEDGFVVSPPLKGYNRVARYYNNNGEKVREVIIPDSDMSQLFTNYKMGSDFWCLSKEGLQQFRIGENGTITILTESFAPDGCTVENPSLLKFNSSTGKLLVTNQAETKFLLGYDGIGQMNMYDGNTWEDISPESVPCRDGELGTLSLPYSPVFDPDDSDVFYVGTWYNGVYKFNSKGEVLQQFCYHNTPLQGYYDGWIYNVPCVQFDKHGNLWIVEGHTDGAPLMVLPRDKKDNENVSSSDWYSFNVNGFTTNHASHFLIVKSTGVKLLANGLYTGELVAFDDNDTFDNLDDDKSVTFSRFTDQDGNNYTWNYITCFVEDKSGKVWMGTTSGIVELNTANIFNPDFTINHLKVPRNDGTNFADYLLDNTHVNSIAVDEINRKWVATTGSGVFLISATGNEVLQHFTTENSYLPSDDVYDVVCNSLSNSVYFATSEGVVEYKSDAVAPSDNFSDVFVYPNPVRPDYSGLITVEGLMDNSLVKITDLTGTVIASGISNGGMFTWDGNNPSGNPVRGGVYLVFVSSSGESSSKGAVAKFLIMR
ncbi:MAG: hypothetical protein J1F10_02655 [Muribaculaceae bacterium]|nr:hypothetical protein [Muribaculaceae bacterium]